jgi:uncharacterized protein (DUF1778 family)
MDVRPYVEQVQTQLAAAAALGDEPTRATADALATAAEPAVRLALLAAVTAAADDITVALLDAPGAPTVGVRLDGDEIRVEVRATEPVEQPVDVPDDDATARVSLRLPEAFKEQVDAAARRDGVSVNTWLLRAASSALSVGARGSRSPAGAVHAQRLSGWING